MLLKYFLKYCWNISWNIAEIFSWNIAEIFSWNIAEIFPEILLKYFLKYCWNISWNIAEIFPEILLKYFMSGLQITQTICETFLQYFRKNISYKFSWNFTEIFHEILLNEKWCGHKNISEILMWNLSERFTVILPKIIPQHSWNISCQVFRLFKLFVNVFCNISETFLTSFRKTLKKYYMKYCWTNKVADIKTFLQSFCKIFLLGCKPFMKPCRNISAIFRAMWVLYWWYYGRLFYENHYTREQVVQI